MRTVLWYLEHRIELPFGELILGRDPTCDIQLHDDAISRHHLRFLVGRDHLSAQDLGSTNGTRLNGARMRKLTVLSDGDALQVGHGTITIKMVPGSSRVFKLRWKAPVDLAATPLLARRTLTTCAHCDIPVPADEDSCPVCQRSLANEPSVRCGDGPRPGQERRVGTRVLVAIPVLYESPRHRFTATAWDLGPGGMFIASDIQDPVVTACRVTLMPQDAPPLPVSGEVCHVIPSSSTDGHPPGLGVRFTHVNASASQWIRETCLTWEDSSYSFS